MLLGALGRNPGDGEATGDPGNSTTFRIRVVDREGLPIERGTVDVEVSDLDGDDNLAATERDMLDLYRDNFFRSVSLEDHNPVEFKKVPEVLFNRDVTATVRATGGINMDVSGFSIEPGKETTATVVVPLDPAVELVVRDRKTELPVAGALVTLSAKLDGSSNVLVHTDALALDETGTDGRCRVRLGREKREIEVNAVGYVAATVKLEDKARKKTVWLEPGHGENAGTLEVVVRMPNGRPLSLARVIIIAGEVRREGETDRRGVCVFENVTPQPYFVEVDGNFKHARKEPEYFGRPKLALVRRGERERVVFEKAATDSALSAQVLDTRGIPVAGVAVFLFGPGNPDDVTTDERGRVEFEELRSAVYALQIGHWRLPKRVDLRGGAKVHQDLAVGTVTISGKIVWPEDVEATGVKVYIEGPRDATAHVRTGEAFEIPRAVDGKYTAYAVGFRGEYLSKRVPFVISEGRDPKVVVLNLQKGGRVEVIVTGAAGQFADDVRVYRGTPERPIAPLLPHPDGSRDLTFKSDALIPGEHSLVIEAKGRPAMVKKVKVVAGETAKVKVHLREEGSTR